MSDFDARKAFEEAHERHEAGERHGARWVPIAAAILAVVTAIFSLLGAQRSTKALVAKNEAILRTAQASDAYNEYESRIIKAHIYEGLVASGTAHDPATLQAIAARERSKAKPTLEKARDFERESALVNGRSEHFLHSYETVEVGVTLLEIGIVLVSISAIATAPLLTIAASAAAAFGVGISLFGLLQ